MITNARDLEKFIRAGDYHTIYFDLDGTTANFNLEYFERTGEKPEDNPAKVWNTFIDWVDRGFFCTLLPIRPTVRLALKLNREGYDVRTLTACGPYDGKFREIKNQKIYWCNKYLPEITQFFVEKGVDKKYFVRHGKKSLLIDDQLSNVTAFIDYGGSAIQYVPDYDYPEKCPISTEENMLGVKCDMAWIHYIEDERSW